MQVHKQTLLMMLQKKKQQNNLNPKIEYFQGRVKFPTGGIVHELKHMLRLMQ